MAAGHVALITGASSGIGAETARALRRERPDSSIVLVARREPRLRELATELGRATYVALDLVEDDAPARVREHLEAEHGGALHLLVNNAGASWRATFADGGYANVRRHMDVNFDAVLRLTEELLPLLRASAPSAIVNVASVAGRVARGGAGAYSASKFALIGWSEALHHEEQPHGVHVGVVNPGFISTEGFPQAELSGRPQTRWLVSTPEKAAAAILDAGLHGKAERYVPRPWAVIPAFRLLFGGLARRIGGGAVGKATVTKTGADQARP
jgi:short-subunit dehydrogenase